MQEHPKLFGKTLDLALSERRSEQALSGRMYRGILGYEASVRDYDGVDLERITTRPARDVTSLVADARRVMVAPRPHEVPSAVVVVPVEGPRLALAGEVQDRRARLYELQRSAASLAPTRRVATCHRLPSSGGFVDIRAGLNGRAYLGGVQTCGSVWHCPVCAAKVTEARRAEVQALGEFVALRGGQLLMLTLTAPHKRHDRLEDLVQAQRVAYRYLVSGKNALARIVPGYAGMVRAQELTVGENGWHPHWHTLVVVSRPLDPDTLAALGARIHARWSKAVATAGLGDVSAAGSNLVAAKLAGDPDALSEYVCKWGAAEELTKLHTKDGKRAGSRTPWQLLSDYAGGDDRAGALWCEYSEVLHGGRQLVWSKGLKRAIGLEDWEDDVLAAADADGAHVLRVLTRVEWVAVRAVGSRARLLTVAEAGPAPLNDYLLVCLEKWLDSRDRRPLVLRDVMRE